MSRTEVNDRRLNFAQSRKNYNSLPILNRYWHANTARQVAQGLFIEGNVLLKREFR